MGFNSGFKGLNLKKLQHVFAMLTNSGYLQPPRTLPLTLLVTRVKEGE